jgi:NTP pyrophosphatase (non-canonical NTP hydrolase)
MAMHANGLAKLLEECGEVSAVAGGLIEGRLMPGQGMDEPEDLLLALQDELADVWAASSFVSETFGLDTTELVLEVRSAFFGRGGVTASLAGLVRATGELSQVAAKKLAYFDTDEHPDGAGSLALRLTQGTNGCLVSVSDVSSRLLLDTLAMRARQERKLALFRKGHAAAPAMA